MMDCKIFENYEGKEYKIKTEHKIFGASEVTSVINGFIDDDERVGIIAHGKELYCYKKNGNCNIVEGNNMVVMSDDLMKIFICI